MKLNTQLLKLFIFWGLKFALAFAFLSAVADRFGLWGQVGTPGVVWGNFENFIAYTQILTPWSSGQLTIIMAWIATALEIIFGILLCTNFKTKIVTFLSGVLLLIFAISMIFTVGLKATLDYSVLTASFAAFLLAFNVKQQTEFPSLNWSRLS